MIIRVSADYMIELGVDLPGPFPVLVPDNVVQHDSYSPLTVEKIIVR